MGKKGPMNRHLPHHTGEGVSDAPPASSTAPSVPFVRVYSSFTESNSAMEKLLPSAMGQGSDGEGEHVNISFGIKHFATRGGLVQAESSHSEGVRFGSAHRHGFGTSFGPGSKTTGGCSGNANIMFGAQPQGSPAGARGKHSNLAGKKGRQKGVQNLKIGEHHDHRLPVPNIMDSVQQLTQPEFTKVGSKRHACDPISAAFDADTVENKHSKSKFCFRCFTKGHANTECQASVYCEICESEEHVKQKCPIKKSPKNIVQWVGHPLDGNGFFHIPHAPIKSVADNKTARITLEGGHLSATQLTIELQSRILCQSNWDWDVREEENAFIVTLPTKEDLQRAISFGGMTLKDKKIHLNFEIWDEEEEGLLIPKAWINIFKIPKKLRELPVLWAIGSMVGVPQMVDMVTTNKSSYGRVLVSIVYSKAFPQKLCVVTGDRWYEFPLKVESIIPGVESYVETSDDLDEDDVEGKSGDRDAFTENDNGSKKRLKSGDEPSNGDANKEATNMDTTRDSYDQPQQVDATSLGKYRAMAEGTVDSVTGQHFEKIANKVIMEEDEVVPIHQLNKQSFGDVNRPHVVSFSITPVKVYQSAPEFGQAHVEGQNGTLDSQPDHIALSALDPTSPRVMLADKEVSIPKDVWVVSKLSAVEENFMPQKSIVDCPGQQVTIASVLITFAPIVFFIA